MVAAFRIILLLILLVSLIPLFLLRERFKIHQTKFKKLEFTNDIQASRIRGYNLSNFISKMRQDSKDLIVAIGGAITSRRQKTEDDGIIRSPEEFIFFSILLVSFCQTATPTFSYRFYLGYDQDDMFFTNDSSVAAFHQKFTNVSKKHCGNMSNVTLTLVACNHSGKPAWAQNDAMMRAYSQGADYFYRLNDDTRLVSPGWTETFIATLSRFRPPNVGVVGPTHEQGNVDILVHDFVHRTHIDIFGFFYPRMFKDWWADRWISTIYPDDNCERLAKIMVEHTMALGQRYQLNAMSGILRKWRVKKDKRILKQYITKYIQQEESNRKSQTKPESSVFK